MSADDADYSFSGFYRLSPPERRALLVANGLFSEAEMSTLATPIDTERADKISEDVVGVFGLPLALVPGVLINGKLTVVPLATEEPSVVAGLSKAAKILRFAGGIKADVQEPVAHGMVALTAAVGETGIWRRVEEAIRDPELSHTLDLEHPSLVSNGGGCRGLRLVPVSETEAYVDVAVAVAGAMGANAASRYATSVANHIRATVPVSVLARVIINEDEDRGVTVKAAVTLEALTRCSRCSIEEAKNTLQRVSALSAFASHCPARCYTHNKGILNGVEAVALALGQDTRAIMTANSALMHRTGIVQPLVSHSYEEDALHITGEIRVPLGLIGGCLRHQTQASILASHYASPQEAMASIACAGVCSSLAALLMLVSAGGVEEGHLPLAYRR